MERWYAGQYLLEKHCEGNRDKFFKFVESGEITPRYSETSLTKQDYCERVLPAFCQPLLAKQARIELLELRLKKTDDEILKDSFYLNTLNDDQDEFDIFKVKEGPALIEKLSQERIAWKKESEKLRTEIGDLDKILAPSSVWRGRTQEQDVQEMLLEAVYFVNVSVLEESPTENQAHETDEDIVKRLKLAGKEDKEIARELKKALPQTTRHRLGKLITNTGEELTVSGWQKRADKLLPKAK